MTSTRTITASRDILLVTPANISAAALPPARGTNVSFMPMRATVASASTIALTFLVRGVSEKNRK